MIIVSITGPDMNAALAQITASSGYADMFEFRLDLISGLNLSALMNSAQTPVIATCRPAWEGGSFTGSEVERVNMLISASVLGADFVDLELHAQRAIREEFLRRRGDSQVIISHHVPADKDFNVKSLYHRLRETGADVVKMAFTATDASDNRKAIEFLTLAGADKQAAIAIAMGEAGEPSRVLYRKFGGWATYASSENGAGSAPGQIPASMMKKVYRTHTITTRTKIYGVIGNPLKQSKGIFVHNEMFRRAEVNAVYCRFVVVDLPKFMRDIAPILQGFSVTTPHKQDILFQLERLEPAARKIGAVNTVVRRSGILTGSNSDADAALDAIETVEPVKGKTMLVIGSGGAARAIVYEALRRDAHVVLANRTAEKAQRLAQEFRARTVAMEEIDSLKFDILVNATSIGMVPNVDATPVPPEILRGKIVFDAVYNPPMTRLLTEATAAGATVISGVEMYLNQAAKQAALFSGKRPDPVVMRRILLTHL